MRQLLIDREMDVVGEYLAGNSAEKTAAQFDVSRSTILRVLHKYDVPLRSRGSGNKSGSEHPNWKGGSWLTGEGYRRIQLDRDDEMAEMRDGLGYVLEHRLVMARAIGRPLTKTETVHHINGIKDDNQLGNLQLRFSAHGMGQVHVCGDCGSRNILSEEL